MNCQKIELNDKFFYDTIIDKLDQKMVEITQPRDLVQLGLSLSMNRLFMQDYDDLIKKFYAHCFTHRFLLTKEDKEALNSIFQHMEITKIYGGHLDIFKEVKRGEQQILVKNTLFKDVNIPDFIGVNFDFENKVVIFLNKKS